MHIEKRKDEEEQDRHDQEAEPLVRKELADQVHGQEIDDCQNDGAEEPQGIEGNAAEGKLLPAAPEVADVTRPVDQENRDQQDQHDPLNDRRKKQMRLLEINRDFKKIASHGIHPSIP